MKISKNCSPETIFGKITLIYKIQAKNLLEAKIKRKLYFPNYTTHVMLKQCTWCVISKMYIRAIYRILVLESRLENHVINSNRILRVSWHPRDAFIDDTLISTSC